MILNLVIKVLLYCCAIATLLTFLPGSILLDIKPRGFKVSSPKNLNAFQPLEASNVVEYEELPIHGPESIAIHKGRSVTGSSDGYIYEIVQANEDTTFKRLVRVIDEPECMSRRGALPSDCGHPLGIKFDSNGDLFVVEPSRGIYRIAGLFTQKPSIDQVLDIKVTGSKFLDDIAILERPNSRQHVLFITDVSRKFQLEQAVLSVFASDVGRILKYDMSSQKKPETLVDSLLFPNGIEVTPSGDALLFAEFTNRSIHKYHLSGPRKGSDQLIMYNLPAEIDNVRLSASGKSLWLAMLRPQTLFTPNEIDYYLKKPLLRKLIARASFLAGKTVEKVSQLIFGGRNEHLNEVAFGLHSMYWMLPTLIDKRGGMMMEIDFDGNVLSSFYSQNDTRLGALSEVREIPSNKSDQRVFYLGSFSEGFLRRLIVENK